MDCSGGKRLGLPPHQKGPRPSGCVGITARMLAVAIFKPLSSWLKPPRHEGETPDNVAREFRNKSLLATQKDPGEERIEPLST